MRGVGEEAGHEAVGQLLEGVVNLGLQLREASGVPGELFGPELLLGRQLAVDLGHSLLRGWNVSSGRGLETDAHGKSFRLALPPLLG